MKGRAILAIVFGMSCCLLAASPGPAQPTGVPGEGRFGPPPARPAPCTDGAYLYVLERGRMVQMLLADGSLVQTVELSPPEAEAEATESERPVPPRGPAGLCTDGIALYAALGGEVRKFVVPDLTLQAAVEIPLPENGEVQATTEEAGPPPPAPSGIFTDGVYVYVAAGGSLFQYSTDLSLVATLELQMPGPPEVSQ